MKILLAVDGSTYSDAAIEEVARRPWPPQSEVKVIIAAATPIVPGFEPWTATPGYFEDLERAVHEGAQSVMAAALSKLHVTQDKTLKINGEIIKGSPKQVIVEEADKWDADLIVMGSRGLGAWNRLLLGSVSNSVVQHAHCSVEVVRSRLPK